MDRRSVDRFYDSTAMIGIAPRVYRPRLIAVINRGRALAAPPSKRPSGGDHRQIAEVGQNVHLIPVATHLADSCDVPGSPAFTVEDDDGDQVTKHRPTVLVAGLGDTGVLVATRLSRSCHVIGVSTRPALVSGQELGTRLIDLPRWKRTYLVPYRRFRRLDAIEFVHGRITSTDLEDSNVTITSTDGTIRRIDYDAFVIATGVSNGFWRHDRLEDLAGIDESMDSVNAQLSAASTIAVVGGGATGVSVADNLARRGGAQVHLFHSGDEPLPGFHPDVRSWIVHRLTSDGVIVHPHHRAEVPEGFLGDALTTEPIEWSSGQDPFTADVVLWAVGAVRPHTSFLPAAILDEEGFVKVDGNLRVPGATNVFAVGDVAASDPLRSSARNWGYRVIVANVSALLRGRSSRFRTYRPAPYRWGSLLGLQSDGLTVVQPNGRRVRIPRPIAQRLLLGTFVQRVLYGGLRRTGA